MEKSSFQKPPVRLRRKSDPISRWKADPRSRTLAIEAKCWDCCGSGADGVEFTRETIGECVCTSCPLHSFRPYQKEKA